MIEIGGLQRTTLIDYSRHIAATVFLIGCNFRCPFCYSSELVLPEKIKSQPRISEKDFFDFLKERKGLIEGVVICGGEPTIHKDLPNFIKKIKNSDYLVKLDTNGSNPKILRKLIDKKLIDYVALDIKAPKEKYNKACGVKVNIQDIEKSIKILKGSKINFEFRTTVVPTIHTKEDIIEIAKWIGSNPSIGSGQGRYYLQNFRPDYNPPSASSRLRRASKHIDPRFEKIKPYSKEFLISIKKEISPFFENVQLR